MTYIFHLFTLIQKDFIVYSNLKSGQIVYKSTARRRAWASKTQHEAEVNLAVFRTPQNGFCGVLYTLPILMVLRPAESGCSALRASYVKNSKWGLSPTALFEFSNFSFEYRREIQTVCENILTF